MTKFYRLLQSSSNAAERDCIGRLSQQLWKIDRHQDNLLLMCKAALEYYSRHPRDSDCNGVEPLLLYKDQGRQRFGVKQKLESKKLAHVFSNNSQKNKQSSTRVKGNSLHCLKFKT